mgnify:CR=1 FL=1|jgi:hypothetical protein
MPQFSLALDVDQGFNFRKDQTVPVGFITTLSINGKALAADIKCKDPLNPTTDLSVFGVLSSASWEIGVTDAIYFSSQISAPNRNAVLMLTYLDLTNVEVKFKYNVYNYDPVAKTYYLCFHCGDTEMLGILEKCGKDLTLSVANDASTEVQSPINYSFSVGIKPQQTAQTLTLATANQQNVVKQWGLTSA